MNKQLAFVDSAQGTSMAHLLKVGLGIPTPRLHGSGQVSQPLPHLLGLCGQCPHGVLATWSRGWVKAQRNRAGKKAWQYREVQLTPTEVINYMLFLDLCLP